jgi:NADPH-dependent ferric siderophore reductase
MAVRERFPRCTGVATLVAREQLTPRMIRVTLRCDGFCDGAWPIEQPGEIVTLYFAPPGDDTIVLPSQNGWRFPDDGSARPELWRNYTVRRHHPERNEIEVDVVLHEPKGHACTWAAEAEIGAGVGYAGPRLDFVPREDAEWLLLCGDETALPAIAAILETTDVEHVLAVLEVADPAEERALDVNGASKRADIRFVHRDGAAPATTTHLADALREIELPGGLGQAWGAAESKIARDVRTVLRDERGMPKTHAGARGYWLRSGDWLLDDD